MWIKNRRVRDLIGAWFESIATEVCEQHSVGLSQEHQVTARIGQALEQSLAKELGEVGVLNHKVTVVTQDIPDKGPNSLERSLGADLYVGIEIVSESGRVSKGFLVQSKWDGPLTKKEKKSLSQQCGDMLQKSSAAYIWVYSEDGIRVQHAELAIAGEGMTGESFTVGRLLSEVLACHQGDPRLGLPEVEDASERRRALAGMLRELSIPHGVSMSVRVPYSADR